MNSIICVPEELYPLDMSKVEEDASLGVEMVD